MVNNLHISLTNIKNESRLFKETKTIVDYNIADRVYMVGLWENGLEAIENLDDTREIYRVKLKSRNLPKGLIFQLLKYIEFTLKLLIRYRDRQVCMVNVHALSILPIGIAFKLLYKTKLIYDTHEYETQRESLVGVRKKLSQLLERYLIRYCDRVIVVSNSIADEYKRLYPNIKKPYVVLNTPLYQQVLKRDLFREKFSIDNDKTIFLYQGGLNRGRGIEVLLDTFKNIEDQKSVIVFMGYGSLEELVESASKECKNIYFHEAVKPDILLEYTSSADFGILFYENNCLNHYYCSPNKIFEYLMAGLPVIVSNLYEMKNIVEINNIGVVAEKNTPQGLKEAVQRVIKLDRQELETNIYKVKNLYNWEEQEKVLLKVYKELV